MTNRKIYLLLVIMWKGYHCSQLHRKQWSGLDNVKLQIQCPSFAWFSTYVSVSGSESNVLETSHVLGKSVGLETIPKVTQTGCVTVTYTRICGFVWVSEALRANPTWHGTRKLGSCFSREQAGLPVIIVTLTISCSPYRHHFSSTFSALCRQPSPKIQNKIFHSGD